MTAMTPADAAKSKSVQPNIDPTDTQDTPDTQHHNHIDSQRAIARAASITAIGNISSRIVGLIAVTVRTYYFGNSQAASAFELASNIPTIFNDLLAGGMLSSALVPTFSGYAADENTAAKRQQFGALLGALIGLATVGLSALVGVLWLLAQPVAALITWGQNQDLGLLTTLLRLTIPAVIFMNLSGLVTAALFARHRFAYTAFTATAFNLVMILCTALFERQLGPAALGVGLLAGSIVQMAMQFPGLRGVPIRLSLNWRLTGISQIVRLFMPVAGGLVLAQIAAQLSFSFANLISPEGPATMRYAAQVIQFPLGMVVVAISAAILPTLSAQAQQVSLAAFKGTLAQGLRLVCVLIVPSAVGLLVLAQPVIALLFQRGQFTAESTAYTVTALQAAIPGLVFAAIDTPLIFSFYALRDTRTPTLIGLVATVFFLLLIGGLLWLDRSGIRRFELVDLVMANSLKTGVDGALMGFFLMRKIGGLHGFGILRLLGKVGLASGVMGLVVWLFAGWLDGRVGSTTFTAHLIVAGGGAVAGLAVYVLCAFALKVRDLTMLKQMLRR